MQVPLDQAMYACGFDDQKACMRIHTLSCEERHVHAGEFGFGQWYLDHGIVIHGIGPRYLV